MWVNALLGLQGKGRAVRGAIRVEFPQEGGREKGRFCQCPELVAMLLSFLTSISLSWAPTMGTGHG